MSTMIRFTQHGQAPMPITDTRTPRQHTLDTLIARYPRITAHIIAESLGYATPRTAAAILLDAINQRPNMCEWVAHCYKGSALECVHKSIRWRHYHIGYMGSYKAARALVDQAIQTGKHPMFASWF